MAAKGNTVKVAHDGLVIRWSITNHSVFCAIILPVIYFALELAIGWLIQKNTGLQKQLTDVPNVIEPVT